MRNNSDEDNMESPIEDCFQNLQLENDEELAEFYRLYRMEKETNEWLNRWSKEPVSSVLNLEWWSWFKDIANTIRYYIRSINFDDNEGISDKDVQEIHKIENYFRECISLIGDIESEHRKCHRWMQWGLKSTTKKKLPRVSRPYRVDNAQRFSVNFLKKFKILLNTIILLLQDQFKGAKKIQVVDHLADLLDQL